MDPKFVNADGIYVGHYTDPETGDTVFDDGTRATGLNLTPASREETIKAGERLRDQYPFVRRDWDFTTKHDIKHIRLEGDYSGYDSIGRRFGRALETFKWWEDSTLDSIMFRGKGIIRGFARRVGYAIFTMKTEDHLPDGVLDRGNIITHWAETGDYLELVQPQVGDLIAEFLINEPDNPHAQKIAAAINHFGRYRYDRYFHPEQTDEDEETTDE